mmetsp:Transcript_21786/g.53937  ORF Transcript_21786/g.53937 Transcript_21786/m.53937 type:complete len:357 (-) Transcript_21786:114-1184(-)|eukprot:CAMPEP_0197574818 /NCGR_PEP_ID=MMETSP1326-20131121/423_1 /TAXON_ID=1155430 /ORGANISM="Genus nov. species nov., Strain RCC2288" /LENGTH=356 /DNA_ID=CAMNT_0043137465 /DNA_START=252 /DNA_END=1322 /DNA_ORIENTATION=-
MSFGGPQMGVPQQGGAAGGGNANNDFPVANPPTDGISSLCWSPTSNFLVATSWDCDVLCYEVTANGQAVPKASIKHEAPVLCSAWNADGTAVFSAGCDNMAKKWDLATNQPTQVAKHDAPIRHLAWIQEVGLLVTGGWDKTLRYWDTRQPSPALQVQLPERLYSLSVVHPLLVVGTAERHIQVFNLSNPQVAYKSIQSPLKYQTRCVAAFPGKQGYLVGSIEGRVAVNHVEDSLAAKNFTFKCHREQADIYAVNSIAFHPVHGTFVTTGADGVFNFWDKDSKQRLKQMNKCNAPIPCGAFNRDGTIFAYAVSYDWSKGGADPMAQSGQNNIFLHAVNDTEVKPRPATANRQTGGRR